MKQLWFKKFISFITACAFLVSVVGPGYAQGVRLPAPGQMVPLSAKLEPALMVGVQVDPKDPFRFNFIISRGAKLLSDEAKEEEYRKLLKYFLVSLTIPNDDMWVNLSPNEADRIIPDNFSMTGMGRDLLAQDYLLKQVTSSLISPEGEVGKKFWKEIYQMAFDKYGTTDIPLDTFNKVWIVPDKAVIYEKQGTALAVKSHLKVMLESDYLALQKSKDNADSLDDTKKEAQELAKKVVREVVIPALEKEVNEGENFIILRQVYSAMLMATWFKKTLKQSILGKVYANKSKMAGVELNDPEAKKQIYEQYLQAYKVGVFNFIKEEQDPFTQEMVPRKYFSGGAKAFTEEMIIDAAQSEALDFIESHKNDLDRVATQLTSNILGATTAAFSLGKGRVGVSNAEEGRFKSKGKAIPGAPLKSQNEYNRDVDRREKFIKRQDVIDRYIAPGKEDYEKFQPLYDEVRGVLDRLLITQGLNPQEFQFFLADTVEPNAFAVNYYNTIVINLGLIRMLEEYAKANNIVVTQDALAWVLAHEVLHIMQNRREIDEGRIDEKKRLLDRHAEGRGKEYQSDLLALWLMDRSGFSVKTAPHILEGFVHWLTKRGIKNTLWGVHPDDQERIRRLEHQILSFHWLNQDAQSATLNSVAVAQKRTRFREFQEQVIHVATGEELISLLNQARTIDELQFAMLIGFEVLPGSEKGAQKEIRAVFEKRISYLAGSDEAKEALFGYMRDEVYVMLGLMRDDISAHLDSARSLGKRLSAETILQIYEIGVPDIFSLSIDVDQMQSDAKHKLGKEVLQRLNASVFSLKGPQRASDRFNSYASGFLYGLYTRMIEDTKQGRLSLTQARRFLADMVSMQESQGYFAGYLFATPLQEMAKAFEVYGSQLTPEDIQLLIQVYEILGTKVNYRLNPEGIAQDLYKLARVMSPDAKKELMDWLLRQEDGWNAPRSEFIKLDIKTMFKEGRSLVFDGGKIEYLEQLLSNNNVVQNMQDALKTFVEIAHFKFSNISSEDLVVMHQKIFTKFREKGINNDLGIYWQLQKEMYGSSGMFSGDAFDKALFANVPEALRPLLHNIRPELKPAFYVFALGGIPEGRELRNFVFNAFRVRERDEDLMDNPQVQQLIESLPVQPGFPENFATTEERYDALGNAERLKVRDLWDRINPQRRMEHVHANEFGLFKALLEYYRNSIGERLSEKGASPEQQEEAFGKFAAPFYLQALFVELGFDKRLDERDVEYARSAWQAFAGDIARKSVTEEGEYAASASKQRPRNAVRFGVKDMPFEDFVELFNFVKLLPGDFNEAVDSVVKGMPPSVFRNFVLHMLFVRRILVDRFGYSGDNDALFDLPRMKAHLASLSVEEGAMILPAIADIAPYFVRDELMEDSNKVTLANYWRERYSSSAPKLDEADIRQRHGQEIGHYDDMMYSVPGGSVSQLYVFASRLSDSEIKNTVGSAEFSLADKREVIEIYYPQSSLTRDRWIKAAIQSQGKDKSVEEIEKLLAMINNQESRDILALSALDQYRSEHPDEFGVLSDALQKIQRFFPEASLIRDDILSETAQYLAKTPPQYEEVRALYLDPFKKINDLDNKRTARSSMHADVFREWMKSRDPNEKADFLLWIMGVTDEKPLSLVDFEYNFHVNADSMREDFGRRQSQYYPLAGQSSQREALEPFLYGRKGIFNDGTAMSGLLGNMFDFLIQDGPNKEILKKVYDKVFEKADQSKREEVFLSLVWTLSLQRGEVSGAQQNISSEKQQARAVRMFLESLGLVGRQLAQVLARSLWVTKIMRDELALVQDNARRIDKGVVFDMVEKFGLSGEFKSIEEPLGSAKVAGVYRVINSEGGEEALKVKRPEVDKTIESDMMFLRNVFDDDLKDAFMAEGVVIPDNFILQIEEGFRQELDFKQEARNTTELAVRVKRSVLKKIKEFSLRKLFGDTRLGDVQGDYEFYVPKIIGVVNNSLIRMEYIKGTKLSNEERVGAEGYDQADIELAVANELLREIFYEGFYHGDPHLGNILVQKGENGRVRIILIDAGASFDLAKNNRRLLGKLMVSVRDNQGGVLEGIVQELGGTVNDEMKRELADQVLGSHDSVGQKLLWFFHVLEKNHVRLPNELLQIMRFFATGQALFDRGNPGAINEAQNDFAQTDQLERIIDQGVDKAASNDPVSIANPGGIDFNENNLDLQIKRDGNGIPLPLESQDPALLNIQGLAPIIIRISPVIPSQMPSIFGPISERVLSRE